MIWQCRRTAPLCEELRAQGLGALLHERTGLTIDPLFSATKIRWLLDQLDSGQERAEAGESASARRTAGWPGTWRAAPPHHRPLQRLADPAPGAPAPDWDNELLELFGVPRTVLPELAPSSGSRGTSVALGRLPADVPIASQIGDSHAALYGQAGFHPGSIKATYGTGSSLMTPTPRLVHSKQGLSSTLPGRPPGRHLRSRGQHPGHRRRRPVAGRASRA